MPSALFVVIHFNIVNQRLIFLQNYKFFEYLQKNILPFLYKIHTKNTLRTLEIIKILCIFALYF